MKTFLEFCQRLGVKLTPAQRVLARVAFDGEEPGTLVGAEREIARTLFGDVETIPPAARDVIAIVAGARSGKTYLGALRLLHLAINVPLGRLAAGENAFVIFVAPDTRIVRQNLKFALGAVRKSAELAPMLGSVTADSFVLHRHDGHSVTFACLPASRGGSAVRGRTLLAAQLDELCFFRDSSSVVNDADVYAAAAPRVMPGGQMIVSSTPWAEAGLLYELYRDQWGAPKSVLVVHAPTTTMRPVERVKVEAERLRDPINCEREFDAIFGSVGSGTWFDAQAIEDARGPFAEPLPPREGARCTAAIDLAFTSDSSAIAIVRDEGAKLVLVDWLEKRPKRGAPLKPSEVLREFAALARRHGVRELWGDGHNAESAREHLSAVGTGFRLTPGGTTGKEQTYRRAQQALVERKVVLPAFPRLLQQFKDVSAKSVPGGGVSISHPRRAGQGHGDLCAAVVLALAHSVQSTQRDGAWAAPPNLNSAHAQVHGTPQSRSLDNITMHADGTLRLGLRNQRRRNASGARGGGF